MLSNRFGVWTVLRPQKKIEKSGSSIILRLP
jgi:hypothetical protein